MVHLTIDGKAVTCEDHITILQACRENKIFIPTLCQDDRLSKFGGCRLCIVEVEGYRNFVASCCVNVAENMVVRTHTPAIIEARRVILDLLLSNHPMECLTCDKQGRCDLQNLAYLYDVRPTYLGAKKNYTPEGKNPVMLRDQSKCILCGKCVRVCDEIQVTHAIDFVGRGFESKIAAGFDMPLDDINCRLCGQCISVCPTGAILNKQLIGYREEKIKKVKTTCPFCGTGCNFDLNVANGKVIGVTPNPTSIVNGESLCVKGRYHTDLMYSDKRIKTPMKKVNGEWVETTWEDALSLVAERLSAIKEEYGPDAIAGFSSARTTNEDNFAFQKFMRAAIGTNNVDHCART